MDPQVLGIAASLAVLTAALSSLSLRGLMRFARSHFPTELMWGVGLALASVATAGELLVYLGVVTTPLLQLYVFLSAAIVGMLSLGSTRVLRQRSVRVGYTAYTLAACALVAVFSFTTPLSPASMVTGGVISGNPPATLLVLSSLVTVPATLVLLGAVLLALRKQWRWRTVMMGIGASVLAAGGALYIASFPVALYYSEFVGIVLITLGLVSLPHVSAVQDSTGHAAAAAAK